MWAILSAAMLASLVPTAAPAQPRGYYEGGYGQQVRDRGGRDRQRADRRAERDLRRDYGDRRVRCRDSGTGGTIIGAIAGGLLGNAAVGRRGDNTTGTIIGAGVGALAGRAIDRSDGRGC